MSFLVRPFSVSTSIIRDARQIHQAGIDTYLHSAFGRTKTPSNHYIEYTKESFPSVTPYEDLFDQPLTEQLISISLNRESLRDTLTQYLAQGQFTPDEIGELLAVLGEDGQLDGISLRRVDVARYTDEIKRNLI